MFLDRRDGAHLWYETFGDPAASPILLLEGLGGDIPGWRRNIPTLARELFVIAHDHRGNARSTFPDAPLTMTTLVDDLIALLDHLGIGAAHVYGQSLGGMVAIEAALTRPERVRSLILAATNAGAGRATPSRERAPKDEPWRLLYAPHFPDTNREHVAEDLRSGTPQDPGAARRQHEAMRAWDAWDRLGEIRAPTLVLHGSEDRLIHPENARRLAAAIPGAHLLLLEGAGHVYHSEQPEAADAAVLGFIREMRDG